MNNLQLQMISANPSSKLTGFRTSAQTCHFHVATKIAGSFMTTHMAFATSIAGVPFGGRYHQELPESATG